MGLAQVAEAPGATVLDGAAAAFVTVAAPADDEAEFKSRVAEAAADLDLVLLSLEEIRFALGPGRRARRRDHDPAVARRARESREVEWDVFHSWDPE